MSKHKLKNPLIKWIMRIIGITLITYILLNGGMFIYLAKQLWGQLQIITGAEKITKVLEKQETPDSLKRKLRLVSKIRNFATDSLHLKETQNYTTFYDQNGKPVLWVVEAALPYKLEAYTWNYPIFGDFSYKGFFNHHDALEEKQRLKEKNLDVRVRTVEAWSTLGFFKDPVLSGILDRSPGRLAELLTHEITHATVFIKDSMRFNENLATFVGREGAKSFLRSIYGRNSKQLINYENWLRDKDKFYGHFMLGVKELDSLYNSFSQSTSDSIKSARKKACINSIVQAADTLSFYHTERFDFLTDFQPNNARLMQFLKYHGNQPELQTKYTKQFDNDLPAMIRYYKEKYE